MIFIVLLQIKIYFLFLHHETIYLYKNSLWNVSQKVNGVKLFNTLHKSIYKLEYFLVLKMLTTYF